MSATAFDAEPTSPADLQPACVIESSPPVRNARSRVRHWMWWLTAPPAVLVATPVMGLDRGFVAVGLLFAALILIRLVQAWSDLDLARREAAGKLARNRRGVASGR